MAIHPVRILAALAVAMALGACATSAPIAMSNDTYIISQTSAGGIFRSMSSLKADVMNRANAFADSKGKVAIPIASKESPAYPGHMPNFEYQFRLVDRNDPRASNGALILRPDVVIENHDIIKADVHTTFKADPKVDTYTELLKLDDLHKKGILTDAEFDAQKRKILESR